MDLQLNLKRRVKRQQEKISSRAIEYVSPNFKLCEIVAAKNYEPTFGWDHFSGANSSQFRRACGNVCQLLNTAFVPKA